MNLLLERTPSNKNIAEWCSGSTADSDSVSRGSNPFSVVSGLTFYVGPFFRSVAQLGRALRSGRRGRVFKSRHFDPWQGHRFTAIVNRFLFNQKVIIKKKLMNNDYYISFFPIL